MSDNAKLQRMIDSGSWHVPAAEYSIDITNPLTVTRSMDFTGSTLRAIPNNQDKGAIIKIVGSNITLIGGTYYGDKLKHKNAGPYGNGAHGIQVTRGSKGITVGSLTVVECMGDGIYIGGGENVLVSAVRSLRNRRQGLSIISGKDITILGCNFENTKGTDPSDGIDLEPDKGDVISGVNIKKCIFKANAGAHIEVASKRGTVKNVSIKDNVFDGKSEPIKIQGREPSLWLKAMALVGNYSKYPTEATI